MNFSKLLLASTLALAALPAIAQEEVTNEYWDPTFNFAADARVDFQHGWIGSKTDDNASGFKGKYLDIMIDGQINKHFKYSWRQRMNKTIEKGSSFFDATDWITLTYQPNDLWDFSAGKQVVAIGGFEYDRAPINIYTASEYWNNIPCYQFGVSGTFNFRNGMDKIMLQVTQSPWARMMDNNNTYSYNAMWIGNHGWYSSLWSVNLAEYAKGKYISYISLGNKFNVHNVSLELDLMNRAVSHQTYFFKDFSMMAELGWDINKHWRIFAKATYDINDSGREGDWCVYDGTELWLLGAGLEYYPLRNQRQDIRVHANFFHSMGKQGNPDGTLQNKTNLIDVGLTWHFNIVKLRKH